MRQIYPHAGPELEVIPAVTGGPLPAAVAELAALYQAQPCPDAPGSPWVRANMIASVDGAADLDGRSSGLGGPPDRMVFGVLRSLADVVLVGAATARAERYKPVTGDRVWGGLRAGRPPAPPIAIVTASLDLSALTPLLSESGPAHAQTIVITTAEAAARGPGPADGSARVVVAGDSRVDLTQAVAALVSMGYRQILTEGGPHLLAQLIAAGLLDELCLTTSPVLAGGSARRIVAAEHPAEVAKLSLAHVLTDAGFLLSRYVRQAD